MNETDSYVITLRQEKQHKLPISVASNKQDPAVSERGNPYEVGALSVLQALLSEEESSINRKLRSATNSRQAHSDNEEHGSRAEHRAVTNVRAISVGVIDRMTDIARPGDITTHTNKVKSGATATIR